MNYNKMNIDELFAFEVSLWKPCISLFCIVFSSCLPSESTSYTICYLATYLFSSRFPNLVRWFTVPFCITVTSHA